MIVNVRHNEPESDLAVDGSSHRIAAYDTNQKLTLQIEAESESEVGHVVGLTQTLLSDSNVAEYDGGGAWEAGVKSEKLPCRDGESTRIPWYNQFCQGEPLPVQGENITLELRDSPEFHFPRSMVDDKNEERTFRRATVSKNFVVTLYDQTAKQVIQQWTWTDGYVIGENFAVPAPGDPGNQAAPMAEAIDQQYVLTGPVPSDGDMQFQTPKPGNWKACPGYL